MLKCCRRPGCQIQLDVWRTELGSVHSSAAQITEARCDLWMHSQMFVQIEFLGKAFPTFDTDEGFLSGVSPLVHVQRTLLDERFAAVHAAVWLLSSVCALVCVQVTFLCIPLTAQRAPVRLLTCVTPLVYFQLAETLEALCTERTGEALLLLKSGGHTSPDGLRDGIHMCRFILWSFKSMKAIFKTASVFWMSWKCSVHSLILSVSTFITEMSAGCFLSAVHYKQWQLLKIVNSNTYDWILLPTIDLILFIQSEEYTFYLMKLDQNSTCSPSSLVFSPLNSSSQNPSCLIFTSEVCFSLWCCCKQQLCCFSLISV